MNAFRKNALAVATALSLLGMTAPTFAASGEMGKGKPEFGVYGAVQGVYTIVWSLRDATVNMPAGCGFLYLTAVTMGLDSYKIAVAILMTAKATNAAVRFYAHADRDGGCGVDYVQML
jgi:hypothetical protein